MWAAVWNHLPQPSVIMGNRSRIIKRLNPNKPIPIVDTGLVFNDCKVYIATDDAAVLRSFGAWIAHMAQRSKVLNMHDYYNTHFAIREKMIDGDVLWN